MEVSMKVKVEHANIWMNISDMKEVVPEMSFEESLSYTTVIGLALGDFLYESKSIINVLPLEQKRELLREFWVRFVSIFCIFIAVVFIIGNFLLFPSYLFSKSKEVLAEQEFEKFNLDNPEISTKNLDDSIKDLNSQLSLLSDEQNKKQVSVTNTFDELLMSRPAGITFSQILYSEGSDGVLSMDVYGVSTDRSALSNFKSILEKNQKYSEVILPISNFLEKTNLNFKISITTK